MKDDVDISLRKGALGGGRLETGDKESKTVPTSPVHTTDVAWRFWSQEIQQTALLLNNSQNSQIPITDILSRSQKHLLVLRQ